MTSTVPLAQSHSGPWFGIPAATPSLITRRSAGDLARDSDNRCAFYTTAGIDPSWVCVVEQVHSRTVFLVGDGGDYPTTSIGERIVGTGDGLISPPGRNLLAVTVADCMPIFISDSKSGAFGLLHSGWKGTGILDQAIREMAAEFATVAGDVSVTLGPCISAVSYEVDEERARAYSREWGSGAIRHDGERMYLDMRSVNIEIAERAGVSDLIVVDACTVADTRLGSYRREGPEFGRMLAMTGTGLENSLG